MLLLIGTFALISTLIFVPYWFFVLREEDDATRQVKRRLKVGGLKRSGAPDLLQKEKPLSTVPAVQRLLQATALINDPIRVALAQAGLQITVGTVVLSAAVVAMLLLAVANLLGVPAVAGIGVAAAGGYIPYLTVRMLAGRRIRKFEEQFPEAVELLARALRAGHAFPTGLSMVADEMPEPVGTEFRLVYDRQAFGMPLPDALRDMGKRVPLIDARFFVTAVLTQRESGGNLSEILDNLARIMRERFTVRREVRSLSAHGRITAWILGALTPILAVLLSIVAPGQMVILITDPIGKSMIAAVLVLQVIGILVIRRIVDIEV